MRILLIEDSRDIGDAIAAKLAREGYKVDRASDGLSGEDFAVSGSYDLVVLDINLPGKDGFAILQSMREARTPTPVLVITARNQVADKVSLLDLGADDYLVKPFDLLELTARIRAVIRRRNGVSQSINVHGPLRVDLGARAASLDGQPVDLGKREFELLELLVANFGNPVSKEQLVLRLFGHDDQGSPNAIELLVSRLRRKLEDSGIEIVTQRGVGYQIGLATTPATPR
ncbi:response regulator transcription factor [Devosia sp. FJ2-5-3]|jgi:two-component system response regulator TctD|uniref:response regulator transcription factor n=1 Tax=Devosia sp. FJ2-5-3 TaxID=2976680 RepID=UPI0023D88387|nr:response regulator transcription factor [Devosia sp. FJ2-5-3]WEJ60159.1 response regulator transcription factor [Devosia sp. FJ2-5-3]